MRIKDLIGHADGLNSFDAGVGNLDNLVLFAGFEFRPLLGDSCLSH